MKLTDEYLAQWFGVKDAEGNDIPNCRREMIDMCSYATKPYESRTEYERNKRFLRDYNNAANPLTKFLMVHAAKVERTPKELMGTE